MARPTDLRKASPSSSLVGFTTIAAWLIGPPVLTDSAARPAPHASADAKAPATHGYPPAPRQTAGRPLPPAIQRPRRWRRRRGSRPPSRRDLRRRAERGEAPRPGLG